MDNGRKSVWRVWVSGRGLATYGGPGVDLVPGSS